MLDLHVAAVRIIGDVIQKNQAYGGANSAFLYQNHPYVYIKDTRSIAFTPNI